MNHIKILNSESLGFSVKANSILSSIGKVKQCNLNRENLIKLIPGYQILIVRLGNKIDKEIIDAAKNLTTIVTATTGLNHIDIDYANQKNIKVLSLKGEYEFLETISATSEHTIALLLALLRNIPSAIQAVKSGDWNRNPYKGIEIKDKNIGILGYGRIGTKVANHLLTFGAKVSVYDIKKIPITHNIIITKSIEELLRNSQILSIHLPFNESTNNLLTKSEFEKMPPDSFLINTSRGEIINEADLLTSIKSKHLAGAAIDVLTNEHIIDFNRFNPLIEYSKKNNNLIITPHLGGATVESMSATEIFMAEKLSNWLKSESHTR